MTLLIKNKFKRIRKIAGISIFAIVLFTNIHLSFINENELLDGKISILGFELELFKATYANREPANCCFSCNGFICSTYHRDWVNYIPCAGQ